MGLLHLNGTLYMKDQAYSLTKNKCPIMVHYYYQCCWVELHALYSSLLENTMELSKMRLWANIYQAFSMCHVLTKPQDYSKRWVLWYPHLVPTRKLRHEGLENLLTITGLAWGRVRIPSHAVHIHKNHRQLLLQSWRCTYLHFSCVDVFQNRKWKKST